MAKKSHDDLSSRSRSSALEDVPEEFARKLPRYPFAPAIPLGRLARDVQFPGTGRLLLVDALKRAYRQAGEIAAATVIVDAKDARACAQSPKLRQD